MHNEIVGPMLCDSYKMVMAYTFFQNGMHEDSTAFELFFRKCPFGGEYVIFAGLSDVMEYLRDFKFTQKMVDYIQQNILPKDANPKFLEYLLNLDCSRVSVRAMKEGAVCFPKEPLISLEGPQVICQLIETALINLVSFPSLIATNASRMRTIVGEKAKLLEFGVRRAQGPDGGFSATKYSYLGGFDGSSNMIAGFKLNIPILGTVAHSFITAFESLSDVAEVAINGVKIKSKAKQYFEQMNVKTNEGELAAFIAFGQSQPSNFLCLVDTYNTLKSGIPNFLAVAFALMDAGIAPRGIRLDSGDLAALSKEAKTIFKFYGDIFGKETSQFIVVASNDINEEALVKFNKDGHAIDVFGIGTNLVTCLKQPALGLVYKLIECKGQGTMKMSEEVDKTTWPYQKNVYRLSFKHHGMVDVVSSLDYLPEQEIKAIDPISRKFYSLKPYFIESLLQPTEHLHTLDEAKSYAKKQIKEIGQTGAIEKPKKHQVLMTREFYEKYERKLMDIQIEEVIA